jgi:hypothetical protein
METVILEKAPKIAGIPLWKTMGWYYLVLTYAEIPLHQYMMKKLSDQLVLYIIYFASWRFYGTIRKFFERIETHLVSGPKKQAEELRPCEGMKVSHVKKGARR